MTAPAELRALALCGPTASGKSELASSLAQEIGGEIVNADSRQLYAGMRIGTGWPSDEQLARAPHHGYGTLSPDERYSAGRFVADARAEIAAIVARGHVPIVVGGTGLYIEALAGSMPLDRPVADDALRDRVRHEADVHPHDALRDWLAALDPLAAARITPGDRYRTLRALEAALAERELAIPGGSRAQKRGTASPTARAQERGTAGVVHLHVVVLEVPREHLNARITERVRAMFEEGIVAEAQAIAQRFPSAPALTGIGYAEALAFAGGLATRAEAIVSTIKRTRAYAKRQQTWFRRLASVVRIDALDPEALHVLHALARESTAAT
jgi:tRNA dimethylallyltransferase